MRIDSVSIKNYKSFLDKQTIHFEPGFNLLLGTNNSGKTSVLHVLDMETILNEPHRSERTIPRYGGQTTQHSQIEVTLATRFGELWRLAGSAQLYLPVVINKEFHESAKSLEILEKFIADDDEILMTSISSHGVDKVSFNAGKLISGVADRHRTNDPLPAALVQVNPNLPNLQIQIANYGGASGIAGNYVQLFKPRIYRFNAQRRPGFQCAGAGSIVLDREATTLPYCLNNLQTNDSHGHKILCGWVNRVFPSVKWVQSTSIGGGFEVRCLPQLPEARRDDLAIPMSSMGAGIGNVIAMFYVLMTSREPQVIAIDEPNAFLHPKALRELLSILEAEGKQHQFILTAHSADVLTAVNTRSISLLDFDGVATIVRQIGPRDLHSLRSQLAELGIRMTDLHAKDRVLWVEGQTEELVMPELLRWACPEFAAGTSVLRVERTGTFSKKGMDPAEVAQVYERLSSSSALVPPMVCILLDGETRSKKSRDEIEKASSGKLRFLARRMLENYLLHPDAVTATILELGKTVNRENVKDLLAKGAGTKCLPEIDGAAVLKNTFSEISDATLEFRKTRDVPILIDWILENDPEYLAPLRDCLRKSFGI
ncbi:MAG: hypothetical protein B7X59_09240 [Polaromonas sp. 39-63-203]|jgi:energy-coupling factor transporter ATP-binding protein EcfA2|uniref:AAA family ATPase n=1 Tax=Polaromonas sp. TaxID=1869339 RepID=UPI000BCC5944|nr:AAA family ATPase [Polaromonas sp.]OYY51798.1 MAG: hypothetical protein B7Y54_09170 [Polaromonas sp. 35-63-240]OYZ83360.1 MAG: hypothetical protein B7Y03_09615 [Polaromonas sp. 24-62-144]OZA96731.1 MAG: hypothetical protein B7X59_09240 [Polaromonas sp. 39-63-203]HQS92116.1 AAA family ATPase [Polaromonas sp.]